MQLVTKLIQILPLQSGVGKNGEWKKQDIIVETQDQYPKKICVSLWGDKASLPLQLHSMYTVDFDVESREYNGKWYTDVKAWKIELLAQQGTANTTQNIASQTANPLPPSADEDDLPF